MKCHVPFKVWCPSCVACRARNDHHTRGAATEETNTEEVGVPAIAMDYAFVQDGEQQIAILVMVVYGTKSIGAMIVRAMQKEQGKHGSREGLLGGSGRLATQRSDSISNHCLGSAGAIREAGRRLHRPG